MGVDFEAFKGLTPERRIQELQKLIDKLKKDIKTQQEEIQQAERLISVADEEARALEQVEIPKPVSVAKKKKAKRIEEITAEPEIEEAGISREEEIELEKLLATAPPRSDELFHKVAHRPVAEIYTELRSLYERERETGIETHEDRERLYALRRGLEKKKEEGYVPPTAQAKHLLTAAEEIAEGLYKGGAGSYKRN